MEGSLREIDYYTKFNFVYFSLFFFPQGETRSLQNDGLAHRDDSIGGNLPCISLHVNISHIIITSTCCTSICNANYTLFVTIYISV